ncbi:hypothetical protein Tco_1396630, partial [Tanacetum coccineum]
MESVRQRGPVSVDVIQDTAASTSLDRQAIAHLEQIGVSNVPVVSDLSIHDHMNLGSSSSTTNTHLISLHHDINFTSSGAASKRQRVIQHSSSEWRSYDILQDLAAVSVPDNVCLAATHAQVNSQAHCPTGNTLGTNESASRVNLSVASSDVMPDTQCRRTCSSFGRNGNNVS